MTTFYEQEVNGRVVISFLLLEAVYAEAKKDIEAEIGAVVAAAYKLVYGEEISEDAMKEIADVLVEESDKQKVAAEEGKDKPPKTKKSLGSSLMDWVSGMSSEAICMAMSGYDLNKAKELYCDQDYRLVSEAHILYAEERWQLMQAQYEAAMYGFGGQYKGDQSAANDETMHDLTKDNKAGLNALENAFRGNGM